ncbi:hypothetical protein [Millionella massiliensis]|uniref:hypothetical protein n=1 Tax=Millionella massiliensis TaxID=1871023 RepID=UPI0008DA6C33|nr:hypothetical protein [Millionella massiliensis]
MNNKFSWSRFGRFACAELVGERRAWLLKLGSFLALCMVIYLLCNISVFIDQMSGEGIEDISLNYMMARFFTSIVLFFLITYNLSCSFKRYFSKGRATAIMMLPVTKNEKFLYATLVNLIVIPCVLLALYLLSDVLWARLLGFDNVFVQLSELKAEMLESDLELFSRQMGINVVAGLACMAFFLAGAAVFRRHQFLWTLLASFILTLPFIVYFQYILFYGSVCARSIFDWLFSVQGFYFQLLWCVLWACLWIFVAWRRFSTLQISK